MIKKLNAHERVLKTLNHEEPDRVPIFEGVIDNLEVAHHFGGKPSMLGLKKSMRFLSFIIGWRYWYAKAMQKAAVLEIGLDRQYRFAKKVGLDIVVAPTAMLLTKCRFPSWDTYVDEFGRMFKMDIFNGVDQAFYMGGYFQTKEDYNAWGPIDPYHPVRADLVKFALNLGKKLDLCVTAFHVGVMEPTLEAFGIENFSRFLGRDKAFAKRVFDDRGKFSLELAKNSMDAGADILFLHDDLAYKGRPFFSPKMMEEYVYPHYRAVVNAAHNRGVKVLLHSCGYITDLLPKLKEIGFDAINPLEPTAGNDIFALKKQFGNKITFIGNVSPQELATGTPEQIAAYTRRLLREMAPGGGYILASGHSINPFVKKENYLAMLEMANKYGSYPIQYIPE